MIGTLVSTLAGVLAGAFLAHRSTVYWERRRSCRETEALKGILLAEIAGNGQRIKENAGLLEESRPALRLLGLAGGNHLSAIAGRLTVEPVNLQPVLELYQAYATINDLIQYLRATLSATIAGGHPVTTDTAKSLKVHIRELQEDCQKRGTDLEWP